MSFGIGKVDLLRSSTALNYKFGLTAKVLFRELLLLAPLGATHAEETSAWLHPLLGALNRRGTRRTRIRKFI